MHPTSKVAAPERDLFAHIALPPGKTDAAEVGHEPIDQTRPAPPLHRPGANVDLCILHCGSRGRTGTGSAMGVVMQIEDKKTALLLLDGTKQLVHSLVKHVIFSGRSSDEVLGGGTLPYLQSPGVLGLSIHRPFAWAIQV